MSAPAINKERIIQIISNLPLSNEGKRQVTSLVQEITGENLITPVVEPKPLVRLQLEAGAVYKSTHHPNYVYFAVRLQDKYASANSNDSYELVYLESPGESREFEITVWTLKNGELGKEGIYKVADSIEQYFKEKI